MAGENLQVPTVKKCEFLSKKGTPYQCLVISYKGYEKRVFLENAENYIFADLPISNLSKEEF